MDFVTAFGGGAFTLVTGYLVPFLAVLTLVVFIHELGHFLVGRWCGVGVHVFSIGFGPELLGFTDRKGTRWKLCAIPLGGYVKFAGDATGASTPDAHALAHMSAADRAVSFHHKSVGRRAAIVAAGPIANFLLAIALFAGLNAFVGRTIVLPRVEAVQPGSAAERSGFQAGDVVKSIDGRTIGSFADMQRVISSSAGETLVFVVERGGAPVRIEAVPDLKEQKTPFGTQRIGLMGLQSSREEADRRHVKYGPVEAVQLGVSETFHVVERTIDYVGKLIVGRESADQLSGPIRIAQVSGQVTTMGGISALIGLAAVLSVSIGLLNLFPIPLLDGGHLLFYAFEALRGRPLSDRAQEIGFRIGLAIVLMLMLFATWNDIVHLGQTFSSRGT
jgi:regulator of sigma E protease